MKFACWSCTSRVGCAYSQRKPRFSVSRGVTFQSSSAKADSYQRTSVNGSELVIDELFIWFSRKSATVKPEMMLGLPGSLVYVPLKLSLPRPFGGCSP